MSSFMKGNRMYNQPQNPFVGRPQNPFVGRPQIRVSVGRSGNMRAAELIQQGRARRLGVGQAPMVCPSIPGVSACAPPVNVCPENQKRYTMPFVPDAGFTATVTAGSQVRFVGAPQKLFKPDRLIIASTIAPYFDIVDLRIANIPQTLSAGNIPADIFSEVSTYTMMSFDQAYPGVQIIITAQNKSSVTQTFQASLIGEAVG